MTAIDVFDAFKESCRIDGGMGVYKNLSYYFWCQCVSEVGRLEVLLGKHYSWLLDVIWHPAVSPLRTRKQSQHGSRCYCPQRRKRLFVSKSGNRLRPSSTRRYARIVAAWVEAIGLDRAAYGTHTMWRTKARLIYRQTNNLKPSRSVYKCNGNGIPIYSDAPCLGAERLEIEPTRGVGWQRRTRRPAGAAPKNDRRIRSPFNRHGRKAAKCPRTPDEAFVGRST